MDPSTSSSSTVDRQWLFSAQNLHNTPTVAIDKQSVFHEIIQRNRGVEFLFRIGLQLKLNVPVLATAAVYFHRFYMRQSLEGHAVYDVAGACIFLACKIEESGRKLKDVAAVCQAKASGTTILVDEHHPPVSAWMKTITANEELLLETLCFDLTVDHPHDQLLIAAEKLQASEHLLSYSWSVINDTFRTPLCVLFPPEMIACACYLFCLHWMTPEVSLSQSLQGPEAEVYFETFGLESSAAQEGIPEIFSLLLDFYNHIKAHVPEKLWRMDPFEQIQYNVVPPYSFRDSSSIPASPTLPTEQTPGHSSGDTFTVSSVGDGTPNRPLTPVPAPPPLERHDSMDPVEMQTEG